jgi:hypothetical protein
MNVNAKKWLLILIPLMIVFGASHTQAGSRHHGGYYGGHSYGHHNGHHGYSAGYFIGGLALGSLLTHAYHRPYSDAYPRYRTSTVYRETVPSTVVPGRRFYRDIDGNCFERLVGDSGDELLKELPAADCDW